MAAYLFAGFRFDAVERSLVDATGRMSFVPPTEAALLEVLLTHGDRVVRRAELLKQAWNGVHVSPATVARQISRVRARLDDRGRRSTIIATVDRTGYRVLVPVRRVTSRQSVEPPRRLATLLPLAVLPITPATDDVLDLAHGLTERLVDRLGHINGLRVIGLASALRFAGRDVSPVDAAAALGAGSVLTGSIERSGSHILTRVEWADRDGTRLWGHRDRVPVTRAHWLDSRLVRRFVDQAGVGGETDPRSPALALSTRSAAALDRLVAGMRLSRTLDDLGNMQRAAEAYRDAIANDPNLTAAHLGLADVWLKQRFMGDARQAAGAALREIDAVLRLEPTRATARAMRAVLQEELDWDYGAAERGVLEALSLNHPDDPLCRFWCGVFYSRSGRFEESLAQLDAGRVADPMSIDLLAARAYTLLMLRKFREAEAQLTAITAFFPQSLPAFRALIAYAHAGLRRKTKAIAAAREVLASAEPQPTAFAWAALALAMSGRVQEARTAADALERRATVRNVPPYFLASIHAACGDFNRAIAALERAADERGTHVLYAAVEPWFDPFRKEPAFTRLMARLGRTPRRPVSPRPANGTRPRQDRRAMKQQTGRTP